jgi:hypothetical protein
MKRWRGHSRRLHRRGRERKTPGMRSYALREGAPEIRGRRPFSCWVKVNDRVRRQIGLNAAKPGPGCAARHPEVAAAGGPRRTGLYTASPFEARFARTSG